jgi:beta-galactosidase
VSVRTNSKRSAEPTGRVWLNVDHAQQGIGSASVGPALPERYRIPRAATTWRLRMSLR